MQADQADKHTANNDYIGRSEAPEQPKMQLIQLTNTEFDISKPIGMGFIECVSVRSSASVHAGQIIEIYCECWNYLCLSPCYHLFALFIHYGAAPA